MNNQLIKICIAIPITVLVILILVIISQRDPIVPVKTVTVSDETIESNLEDVSAEQRKDIYRDSEDQKEEPDSSLKATVNSYNTDNQEYKLTDQYILQEGEIHDIVASSSEIEQNHAGRVLGVAQTIYKGSETKHSDQNFALHIDGQGNPKMGKFINNEFHQKRPDVGQIRAGWTPLHTMSSLLSAEEVVAHTAIIDGKHHLVLSSAFTEESNGQIVLEKAKDEYQVMFRNKGYRIVESHLQITEESWILVRATYGNDIDFMPKKLKFEGSDGSVITQELETIISK